MTSVKIQRNLQAARPFLLIVNTVISTFPKTSYVVYYKNYTQQDEECYNSIDNMKELFLPHRELQFKVINFEKQLDPIFIKNQAFQVNDKAVTITVIHLQGSITITASILNQSHSADALVDLSMISKKGYDQFYKFRKKYKTLQNLTRKIQFNLDHRIKIVIAGKQLQFNLQDRRKQHYFSNLAALNQQIKIVLEEIVSIQDFVNTQIIDETQIQIKELKGMDYSYVAKIKYSNLFQAAFLFDLVKNQNLQASDMVAIRVFQTSAPSKIVKIGTQQSIHLNSCLKLSPLISSKYYDYQWGYLNQNLSQIQGGASLYDHIDKITTSLPKYPHLVNQQIIDVKNSNILVFEIDGQILKIPIVYILRGFNCIENNKISLKFYIDSFRLQSKQELIDVKSDHRRLYELNVMELLNLHKINKLLDKQNTDAFLLKIINQDTVYFIPFTRKFVTKTQFRKQAKQLSTREEITRKIQNKYYSIQNCSSKDQLRLIQSNAINPFYLIEMTTSSSLSFQIIVNNFIALEGSLSKQSVIASEGLELIHMMTSIEGDCKIGICINFVPIQQVNQSAATYYQFKQRLFFAESGQTQQINYDIQIEFDKQSGLRKLKSKISPQLKRQINEGVLLRSFNGETGVFTKQQRLNFTIKIRKMYFNQQLNYFDNQLLMTKLISINPTAQILKQNKAVMLQLNGECYEGIEIDLYDLNVKKRMKYYLEVYACKNQFLDFKDSSYKIRMPQVLWNYINFYEKQDGITYQISTHLNRKRRNTDRASFNSNSTQDIILNHYNYNDGLSINKSNGEVSYNKMLKCLKLRCDVLKDKIGWSSQSDWYYGVMTLGYQNFYFLVQRMFDPQEQKGNDSDESGSRKTVSRERSNRSDKHKIDPLAKTINNMDLFKLKKKKNDLVAQGRQMTARYVKMQEKVLQLTRKIQQMDEEIKKKQQEDTNRKVNVKQRKKQNTKMKQFYRSVCECGDKNPKFNGYCQPCLKKLKQRYQIYLKQYKQKSYEYQKIIFQKYNSKQKIQKLKKKIQGIKNNNIVIDEDASVGAQFLMKDMQQKQLRKTIQTLKIQLFELEEQKLSLIQTSNWQMNILEEKITNQDQTIYKNSQQLDSHRNNLKQLLLMVKSAQQSKGK